MSATPEQPFAGFVGVGSATRETVATNADQWEAGTMATTVRVEGLDELRRVLRRVADKELTAALKEVHHAAARVVVDKALPNVPVRTGRLKRSVRALGSQRSGRAVAGSARVPYAGAIHFGRKKGNVGSPPGNHSGPNKVDGRPFLWDAIQSSTPEIERVAAVEYEKVFARIGLPLR